MRDETGIESSRARVEINIEGAEGGEAAPRVIAATPMNDELQGGPGDDVIEVGGGIDRAEGGGGSDTFQFLFAEDGEREVATITDFEPGTGPDADIVDLNGLGVLASFSVGNDVQMIVDTGDDLDTAVFLGVNDPAMIEIA